MSDVNNDSVVGKGKGKYLPSSSFSGRNNYDEDGNDGDNGDGVNNGNSNGGGDIGIRKLEQKQQFDDRSDHSVTSRRSITSNGGTRRIFKMVNNNNNGNGNSGGSRGVQFVPASPSSIGNRSSFSMSFDISPLNTHTRSLSRGNNGSSNNNNGGGSSGSSLGRIKQQQQQQQQQ